VKTDICSLITVGGFRYVQNVLEHGAGQNPDYLVGQLLDAACRKQAVEFAEYHTLSGLLAHPFYNYLLLRTRYYDEAVLQSLDAGCKQVLIIGAGTDTRAYRFRSQLLDANAKVIECDLAAAMTEKARAVAQLGEHGHVRFCTINLVDEPSAGWLKASGYDQEAKSLIIIEGVTPYVPERPFRRWLAFLAEASRRETMLCCDYKLAGCNDSFGREQANAEPTLRLAEGETAIAEFHHCSGWDLRSIESSDSLAKRFGMAAERVLSREDIIVCSEKRAGASPVARPLT
jgi:methyltransferase (TIGR00027 family)